MDAAPPTCERLRVLASLRSRLVHLHPDVDDYLVDALATGTAARYRGCVARLESYSFGRIVVDGEEQTRDLIVLPHRVLTNWWRRDGHSLVIDDLREVEDELPQKLILGTGAHGRLRPSRAVIEELERRGIDVEALHTEQAVRRYGELDARRTAVALHLTC